MSRRAGQIRIVGGLLRRTPLQVAAGVETMRPTPDRVRETLFNWLGERIGQARCLDLFAGTGALGLEAASRGAAQVFLHDLDARAVRALEARIARLAVAHDSAVQALAGRIRVSRDDALAALAGHARLGRRFDIVFLDPPFARDWLAVLATPLRAVLAPGALIYHEAEHALDEARLSRAGWRLQRQGRAGRVHYHLCLSIEEPLS